jgi:ring-1,2-phenylacetyl-CoA epoxidase subunit PaaC
MATWLKLLWQRLLASSHAELAAVAAKAVKEAHYHQEHAGDWVLRLGDGSDESHRRMQAALDLLWPYVAEMFESDAIDDAAEQAGLGPRRAELRDAWMEEVLPVLREATLAVPKDAAFRSTGTLGRHSEHLGYMLAEMQHLQRSHPGGVW